MNIFRTTQRKTMFTLVELLVVVVIISVLAFLLLPTLSKMTWKAQAMLCTNRMRQCHAAWMLYVNDNGRLPRYPIRTNFGQNYSAKHGFAPTGGHHFSLSNSLNRAYPRELLYGKPVPKNHGDTAYGTNKIFFGGWPSWDSIRKPRQYSFGEGTYLSTTEVTMCPFIAEQNKYYIVKTGYATEWWRSNRRCAFNWGFLYNANTDTTPHSSYSRRATRHQPLNINHPPRCWLGVCRWDDIEDVPRSDSYKCSDIRVLYLDGHVKYFDGFDGTYPTRYARDIWYWYSGLKIQDKL